MIWLIDNSAWSRNLDGNLPDHSKSTLAGMIDANSIAVCPPFLLEAGYSARNAAEHREMFRYFATLPRFDLQPRTADRAVSAQASLSAVGHHRIPPVDLMIAAIADVEELGVIHYDADYDLILEHTNLRFESRWLAPRGTL